MASPLVLSLKKRKIMACFNGHNHIDECREKNDIYYIDINSMSYQWLGEKYPTKDLFSGEQYTKYPQLTKMAPYKDALFAQVTIDSDTLTIQGRNSVWMGSSPEELGLDSRKSYGVEYSPNLSSRTLRIRSGK